MLLYTIFLIRPKRNILDRLTISYVREIILVKQQREEDNLMNHEEARRKQTLSDITTMIGLVLLHIPMKFLVKYRIGWLYSDYSDYSVYSLYSVLHLEFHFYF